MALLLSSSRFREGDILIPTCYGCSRAMIIVATRSNGRDANDMRSISVQHDWEKWENNLRTEKKSKINCFPNTVINFNRWSHESRIEGIKSISQWTNLQYFSSKDKWWIATIKTSPKAFKKTKGCTQKWLIKVLLAVSKISWFVPPIQVTRTSTFPKSSFTFCAVLLTSSFSNKLHS